MMNSSERLYLKVDQTCNLSKKILDLDGNEISNNFMKKFKPKIPTGFVIGAGRMGCQHISNIRNAGLEVVGVFDKNPLNLNSAIKESHLDSKCIFEDFKSLCKSGVPDLAVIATTSPSHCEYGIALARHGVKFLMIEKPLGTSIAQCERLFEECSAAGTRVAVNHMFRFLPIVLKIKELLTSELLGGFTSLTVNGINSGIAMMGSHCIDLFEFFSESPSTNAAAWLNKSAEHNPRGSEYHDYGGLVVVHSSKRHRLVMDFPTDQGQGREMLACGRNGMIRFDLDKATISGVARRERDRTLPLTRSNLESVKITFDLGLTDYELATVTHIKNLLSGGQIVGLEEATRIVSVLVAAHNSSNQDHSPIQIADATKFKSQVFEWA